MRIIRATNRRINENPPQHVRRTLLLRFSGGCRRRRWRRLFPVPVAGSSSSRRFAGGWCRCCRRLRWRTCRWSGTAARGGRGWRAGPSTAALVRLTTVATAPTSGGGGQTTPGDSAFPPLRHCSAAGADQDKATIGYLRRCDDLTVLDARTPSRRRSIDDAGSASGP